MTASKAAVFAVILVALANCHTPLPTGVPTPLPTAVPLPGQTTGVAASGTAVFVLNPSRRNFTAAAQACAASTYNGVTGWLATAASSDEYSAISSVISATEATSVLLGGSCLAVVGQWRWVTGPLGSLNGGAGPLFFVAASTSASNRGGGTCQSGFECHFATELWFTTEPNNRGGVERVLAQYNNGEWNDVPDTNFHPYMCEYPKAVSWGTQFTFIIHPFSLSWNNAVTACSSTTWGGATNTGWLATPITATDLNQISAIMQSTRKLNMWLGGSNTASVNNWRWVTGPYATSQPVFYVLNGNAGVGTCQTGFVCNWWATQPSKGDTIENSVLMKNSAGRPSQFRWIAANHGDVNYYVCQFKVSTRAIAATPTEANQPTPVPRATPIPPHPTLAPAPTPASTPLPAPFTSTHFVILAIIVLTGLALAKRSRRHCCGGRGPRVSQVAKTIV